MNDAQILGPQYMFVFTGACFIIGSILMNFARIYQNKTLAEEDIENNAGTIKNENVFDEDEKDVEKVVSEKETL